MKTAHCFFLCLAFSFCCGNYTLCGEPNRLERIVEDLQSDVPSVRENAVKMLSRYDDGRTIDLLLKALDDSDPLVRREAAKVLGELEDERAVPGLVEALDDDDKTVRYHAAHALGEIAVPETTAALVDALRDPEWCVQSEAAGALREIGGPRVVRLLEKALDEDATLDLDHVAWILKESDPKRLIDLLFKVLKHGSRKDRLDAIERLSRLDRPEAVDALIFALGDESPRVRLAAVNALRANGDRRALGPIQALVRRETNEELKQAAAKAALILSRHEDLVAHWSFDAAEGDKALDSGGHEIHGIIKNCQRVKGKHGSALEFGENSCVELGKPAEFPVAQRPFTVAAWVKSEKSNGVVVARGGAFCGFSLYVKDGVAKFGIHLTQEGDSHIAAGNENVTGKWVHLAGVVDEEEIRVYVNGEKVGEKKTPGLLPGNCGQSMEIGFDIGNTAAEITDHFVGIIDEVKVFHAALSAEDLAEFCNTQE
ncbi:MAG: HEAT repeat domain-containing protein [Planctomycetota bacterium]